MKKYYVTTPIYYPSAKFHIGHCYTTIIADAIARYKRLDGYNVFFQTGTDEHGLKIENRAKENNVNPKEYVDNIVDDAKDLWKSLNISYDYFIRTTDDNHVKSVQKIFKKLYEQGDIYKGEYKGLYCIPCETFWTSTQAEDGLCPECHREVKEVSEEAYFLKISKYQKKLEELYENNEDFLLPVSRRNEMLNNFIKPGLEDLCVSRTSFSWGIPVDFDNKHVIYVWIDALSNYITSLGYPDNLDKIKEFWPCDLHLVGKEIVRFHAIIWPILLWMLDLPLPKKIFAHGWLVINGDKISKSVGNYEDPRVYVDKFGVDRVRYYVLREVPFGSDGNFSIDLLISRTNTDLANILGNLVNRTIAMSNKYFDGIVKNTNILEDIDKDLIDTANILKTEVDKKMNELKLNEAIDTIFEFLKKCNKYIDDTTPWNLFKENNTERLNTVLYNLLESIRISAILLQAFIPESAEKILNFLNTNEIGFATLKFGLLENDIKLNTPEILFARIEPEDNVN